MWEVDLEACQLLIQEFQLKEGGSVFFEEEGSQTDEVEDAVDVLLSTMQRQSKCQPIKESKQRAVQHPVIQNKHPSALWNSKEVSKKFLVFFCFFPSLKSLFSKVRFFLDPY